MGKNKGSYFVFQLLLKLNFIKCYWYLYLSEQILEVKEKFCEIQKIFFIIYGVKEDFENLYDKLVSMMKMIYLMYDD